MESYELKLPETIEPMQLPEIIRKLTMISRLSEKENVFVKPMLNVQGTEQKKKSYYTPTTAFFKTPKFTREEAIVYLNHYFTKGAKATTQKYALPAEQENKPAYIMHKLIKLYNLTPEQMGIKSFPSRGEAVRLIEVTENGN